jgi:hypothetical protein
VRTKTIENKQPQPISDLDLKKQYWDEALADQTLTKFSERFKRMQALYEKHMMGVFIPTMPPAGVSRGPIRGHISDIGASIVPEFKFNFANLEERAVAKDMVSSQQALITDTVQDALRNLMMYGTAIYQGPSHE